MTNLKHVTIEKVGIDFVRFVNENYDQLMQLYRDNELEEVNINFPTWCMVQYAEQYEEATVISSDELLSENERLRHQVNKLQQIIDKNIANIV